MSKKFTPGPWEAKNWSCHAPTTVMAADRTVIAECAGLGRDADECIADARLIAAAPEPLEALQFVMSAHGEQLDTAFAQAQAAIAKATGGAA